MKTCFNIIEMPVRDMINDNHDVEDIVAVTQFQTCINCGQTIESLKFVDLNMDMEGENQVLTMVYLEAVVNGMTYKIIVNVVSDDQLLSSILRYSTVEDKKKVMDYIRKTLE